MPEGFHSRLADNWRLMLAIADMAGKHWPETARRAAVSLSGETELPQGEQLLSGIYKAFKETGEDRFASADLANAVKIIDDQLMWTACTIARELKPFGIRPHGIRIGSKTLRGYYLSDFEDAFVRYSADREDMDSYAPKNATAKQSI